MNNAYIIKACITNVDTISYKTFVVWCIKNNTYLPTIYKMMFVYRNIPFCTLFSSVEEVEEATVVEKKNSIFISWSLNPKSPVKKLTEFWSK